MRAVLRKGLGWKRSARQPPVEARRLESILLVKTTVPHSTEQQQQQQQQQQLQQQQQQQQRQQVERYYRVQPVRRSVCACWWLSATPTTTRALCQAGNLGKRKRATLANTHGRGVELSAREPGEPATTSKRLLQVMVVQRSNAIVFCVAAARIDTQKTPDPHTKACRDWGRAVPRRLTEPSRPAQHVRVRHSTAGRKDRPSSVRHAQAREPDGHAGRAPQAGEHGVGDLLLEHLVEQLVVEAACGGQGEGAA
jgi:hypothetical protein